MMKLWTFVPIVEDIDEVAKNHRTYTHRQSYLIVMKWLPSLVLGLLCFLLGISFTYWIQGQLVYENVKGFFVTGISFGLIIGLAIEGVEMLKSWRNEKRDEKEKTMVNLGKHTEALIPILKEWAEKPLDFSKEYLFSLAQQHIMVGYKQLWNTIEGTSGIRKTLSQYENLEKETLQSIRNILKKLALETHQKIEPDILDDLARAIQHFLELRHSEGKLYTFSAKQFIDPSANTSEYVLQSLRNDGSGGTTYLKGDRKSLLTLAESLNNVLSDSHLQETTKSLRILASQLYELRNAFKQGISSIIDAITYAVTKEDKILLGYCTQCANVKKKWKID